MLEGGLTPSIGLIERAVGSVSIPVNVMVRPHSLSFHYDPYAIQTMVADIRQIADQTGHRSWGTNAEGRVILNLLQACLPKRGSWMLRSTAHSMKRRIWKKRLTY